ncbi:hypothetical protein SAMN05660653_00203 [Desulfonatronum thiosulfatophilum]|uniref:Uncharacterized protein n=1 Tax=Desulfonatronum thiosulfatophilum TaxID=617002 RepID=A0A1G6A7N1_9BACT|nr:hypothetical protein [Desulfonatronum thiosulfatophilum]SDB04300.1 hypothetical protein SAMN05660653_00203 [Desulfonatronum thiosulfatophilum]
MQSRSARLPLILFPLLGLLMLAGCGYVERVDYWEPRIGPQEIATDAPVFRNAPVISLYPTNSPPAPLSAIFYPPRVTQPVDNPLVLGHALGRIFWQTWNQTLVFPTLVYEEETQWPGLPRALDRARALDVDLIIRAEIPYFLSGGSRGTTGISLYTEIFEVEGGQRVWIMEHSGRMEPQPRRDFIIAHHTRRLPVEPIYSIMTLLACDLAMHVGQWNNGWERVQACR